MTITIENADKEFLKVVKGVAKLANLKVKTTKTESDRSVDYSLSEEDTQDLLRLYGEYERGELETISLEEAFSEAESYLQNLKNRAN